MFLGVIAVFSSEQSSKSWNFVRALHGMESMLYRNWSTQRNQLVEDLDALILNVLLQFASSLLPKEGFSTKMVPTFAQKTTKRNLVRNAPNVKSTWRAKWLLHLGTRTIRLASCVESASEFYFGVPLKYTY